MRQVMVTSWMVLASMASAGEWSQFRGPAQSGVADGDLPIAWGPESNVAWKLAIPGVAWSQPIVWQEKLFVTTAVTENQSKPSNERGRAPRGEGNGPPPGGEQAAGSEPANPADGGERPRRAEGGGNPFRGFGRREKKPPEEVYRWEVHCLDRVTGKTLWTRKVAEQKPTIPTHRTNTYASETPVTDGELVYALFGMTGLYAFTLDGTEVWHKELESHPMMNGWGTGSSPVLVGDFLVLQCDNEEKSYLVAFDKRTGEEKWRVDREERSTWSTPFVWKNKLRTELVTGGSKKIRSYDPATGKILWELVGISGRSASTAVGDEEMVYIGTGGGFGVGPLVAIKAGGEGEIDLAKATEEGSLIAWTSPRGGPPMASPLLYEGHLYVLDQRLGVVTCYDAKTGEVVYKERIPNSTGFTSSPWAAKGKIFCLDGNGTTIVLAAGPKFEVLGTNSLGEMCWSSPACVDGAIYLRTVDHLYCIK